MSNLVLKSFVGECMDVKLKTTDLQLFWTVIGYKV